MIAVLEEDIGLRGAHLVAFRVSFCSLFFRREEERRKDEGVPG